MNLKFRLLLLIALSLFGYKSFAALNGTFNVGAGQTYTTLGAAIADFNTQGTTTGCTFNVVAGNNQVAPLSGGVGSLAGAAGSGYVISPSVNVPTAGAPLIITGNGNTVTAAAGPTAGSYSDAIFVIAGTSYVTIQGFTLVENAANTNATPATNNMTEIGIAIVRGTTTNAGSQSINIKNNTITMRGSTTYVNTIGIYSSANHSYNAAYTTSTANSTGGENSNNTFQNNTISGVTLGFMLVGSSTSQDLNTTIGGGAGLGNSVTLATNAAVLSGPSYDAVSVSAVVGIYTYYNNNITASYNSVQTPSTSTNSANTWGIYLNTSVNNGSTNTINNNTVTLASSSSGQYIGIQHAAGGSLTSLVANNNTISITNNSGLNAGLYNTSAETNITNLNNTITVTNTSGTTNYCLYNGGAAVNLVRAGNIVTNNNTTGSSNYGMYNSGTMSGGLYDTSNKIVISITGASGYGLGYYNTAAAPVVNIVRNNIRVTSASSGYYSWGIYTSGGAVQALNINYDTINISHTSTSYIYGGIYSFGGSTSTNGSINNNNVTINATAAISSTGYGIYNTNPWTTGTANRNVVKVTASSSIPFYGVLLSGTETNDSVCFNNVNFSAPNNTTYTCYGLANQGTQGGSLVQSFDTVTMVNGTSEYAYYYIGQSVAVGTYNNLIASVSGNTTAGSDYGMYNGSSITNGTWTNDSIVINCTASSPSMYGFQNSSTITSGIFTNCKILLNNTFTGAGSPTMYGFYNASTFSTRSFKNDSVTLKTNFGSGSPLMYGIFNSTGVTTDTIMNSAITVLNNSAGSSTLYGIYYSGAATFSYIYNNYVSVTNPVASTATNTMYGINCYSSSIAIANNNKIIVSSASTATSGITAYGIYDIYVPTVAAYNNNNITVSTNFSTYGIYAGGGSANYMNDTINATYGINSPSCYGIYTYSSTLGYDSIMNNRITIQSSTGTTATVYDIFCNAAGAGNYIYNNLLFHPTFSLGSGTHYLIANTGSPSLFNIVANNKLATPLNRTGGGTGTMYCYYNNTNGGNGFENIYGNNFSNITLSGGQSFYGIDDYTATNVLRNIYNDTISNVTWVTGTCYPFYLNYLSPTSSVRNNLVTNFTGAGTFTGLQTLGSCTGGTIRGNNISNITLTSAAVASTNMIGIQNSPTTTNALNFVNDTISNFTHAGPTPNLYGFYQTAGINTNIDSNYIYNLNVTNVNGNANLFGVYINGLTTGVNVYNNDIYNLSTNNNTGTGQVIGIQTPSITGIYTIYNNFISGLNNPAQTNVNAVIGINGGTNTTASTYNMNFNTIYLNTSGAGGNYGVQGILYSNSVTANNVADNIININATPNGTGWVAAMCRNLATATANVPPTVAVFNPKANVYYTNPGANNYLYVDCATSNVNAKNGYATSGIVPSVANNITIDTGFNGGCSLYKTFLGSGREANTTTENNLTAGAIAGTYAPSGTSYAKSNGIASTPAVSFDFASATRPSPADIGALQFTGTQKVLPTTVVATIAPSVTTTICGGGSQLLTANTGTGLGYQWFQNGTAILNATNSTYTATAAGSYTVFEYNSACSGTSTATVININPNPTSVITTPGGVTTSCGSLLLTDNTDIGTIYTWYLNGTGAGNVIAGANTATYTATVSGTYYAQAATTTCSTISTPVVITINPLPIAFITTPSGQDTVCDLSGGVTMVGNTDIGDQYQWYKNGTTTGSFGSTYTALTSGTYQVLITKTSTGCSRLSAGQIVVINPLPTATLTPANPNDTACVSMVLTGSSNVSTAKYTFYRGVTLVQGPSTLNTYTTSTVGTFTYSVVVTDTSTGCSKASAGVPITIAPLPVATITPNGGAGCGHLVLTANTDIGDTFQWYQNGALISGATQSTYTATVSGTYAVDITRKLTHCSQFSGNVVVTINPVPAASITSTTTASCSCITLTANTNIIPIGNAQYVWTLNGLTVGGNTSTYTACTSGTYKVRIINSATGCDSTSLPIVITIYPTPTATISPNVATAACVSQVITATTNISPIGNASYQWYNQTGAITGATSSSYTATVTGTYYVVITNTLTTCSNTSSSVAITINPSPTSLVYPLSGDTIACVSNVLRDSTVNGVAFQWYKNGTGVANQIPLATNQLYTVTSSGTYYCKAIGIPTTNCATFSAGVHIIINPAPNGIVTVTGSSTFCEGGSAVLNATSGYVHYQWLVSGVPIPNDTFNTLAVTQAGNYKIIETNGFNCIDTSTGTNITVNPLPDATLALSGPTTFCSGGSLTMTAEAGYTYQWYKDGASLGGAGQAQSYTATVAGTYHVKLTSAAGCISTSSDVVVTVQPSPLNTVTTLNSIILCKGTTVSFSADQAGATYQWQVNGNNVFGATNQTYTQGAAGAVDVMVSNGLCTVTSTPITVTDATPDTTITALGATRFCQGGSVTLSAAPGFVYQWDSAGMTITGANNQTLIVTTNGNYSVAVANVGCIDTSSNITVIVDTLPVPVITRSGILLHTTTFSSYQWYKNGVAIPGATNENYTATVNAQYTVYVTDAHGCSGTSAAVNLNGLNVNNTANSSDISLYPNPATSTLYIDAPIKVTAIIYTMDGKEVFRQAEAKQLDLRNLPNAAYMVKLVDENGQPVKMARIVKND